MASPLSEFGQTAQRLARNPLGIIALFIVLVYGIAGLVLGFSAANLQPNEKLPLIWFLVIFPVIVLAAFLWLVAHHHMKLYAPHDFPDKEGFFRALTPAEQVSAERNRRAVPTGPESKHAKVRQHMKPRWRNLCRESRQKRHRSSSS